MYSEIIFIIMQTAAFLLLGLAVVNLSFRIVHLRKDIDVLTTEIDILYAKIKNKG